MIELKDVTKEYSKGISALNGINLKIEQGEFVFIVGDSGSGKSTLIKLIMKELEPTSGTIVVNGHNLGRMRHRKVPMYRRNIGVVFQDFRLLKDRNVYENVAFAQRVIGRSTKVIRKRVPEVLQEVGLAEKYKSFPDELSGGEQQRVALARALVIEPKLLLLDEPLSNLDAKLRLSMRVEIKRLQKRLGITTLFVTHDQEECFSISDKVAVMNGGVIEQFDTPENIYKRPATEFVARFIGFENFLELAKKQDGVYTAPDGSEFLTSMDLDCEKFAGTIRPDDICLADDVQTENVLSGKIGVRTFLGKSYQYEVETSAGVLKVNMGTDHVYKEGEEIRLYLPKDKLILVRR